jgi:hypothetical protein
VVEDDSERHGDPAALAAGYERLRAAVLCGQGDGWRIGHGVLASRGMAAWMGAYRTLAPAPQEPGGASVSRPVSSCPASLPRAKELVAVLGEMTLALAA